MAFHRRRLVLPSLNLLPSKALASAAGAHWSLRGWPVAARWCRFLSHFPYSEKPRLQATSLVLLPFSTLFQNNLTSSTLHTPNPIQYERPPHYCCSENPVWVVTCSGRATKVMLKTRKTPVMELNLWKGFQIARTKGIKANYGPFHRSATHNGGPDKTVLKRMKRLDTREFAPLHNDLCLSGNQLQE